MSVNYQMFFPEEIASAKVINKNVSNLSKSTVPVVCPFGGTLWLYKPIMYLINFNNFSTGFMICFDLKVSLDKARQDLKLLLVGKKMGPMPLFHFKVEYYLN